MNKYWSMASCSIGGGLSIWATWFMLYPWIWASKQTGSSFGTILFTGMGIFITVVMLGGVLFQHKENIKEVKK